MKTILLLEDDEILNQGITLKLSREGYQVFSAHTLKEAEQIWSMEKIHMVISDITLPDGSGLAFGKKIRAEGDVYLIYLTARDQEADIANGYCTGADDYITKPFSVKILALKVNALMRRLEEKAADTLLSGELEVSVTELQAKKAGKFVALSRTEVRILIYLMENAGHIVSKEAMLDAIWGVDGQFVDDSTVTVNVSRLKNKLETDCIANVRGLGYLWTDEVIKK
ncbi:MAG: response regulator transcription factor [Roseburia sp.]|nr:response regulator transcription factor [Roseburia sp.]